MNEDDEIIKEFLTECNEHLDNLDNGFVAIEQDSSDPKILSAIFRSIHTIKGGAGMLAFNKLEKLTHAAESLLSLLRDGKISLETEITTNLLHTVDAVRSMLACISDTGQDGEEEYLSLIETLHQLQSVNEHSSQAKDTASETGSCDTETENAQDQSVVLSSDHDINSMEPDEPAATHHSKDDVLISNAEPAQPVESKVPNLADSTIRINVELLDQLMNLVGELVLSRNQILQFISMDSDTSFISVSQRLNLITSELQEGVMKTRMQPIGNVWGKFPRVIRDLATSCQKKVTLQMFGKETELDKTLIEAIKDPLTHIVRNSVDHGIEKPEVRKALGKPEEGTLSLKAYHEGGHVNIEITDDGGGISSEKVKEKALAKGLITKEQASRMSERDALYLIFLPGLSTAEKVTNVSGRGVGMDVVRTNIERINGTIDIQSKVGESTTIKVKIPLTLAIIPALIVTCDSNRYAIPQVNLLELVRLECTQIKQDIKFIKDTPVYKLRGKLLPLVYLAKELELPHMSQLKEIHDSINIVVLQAGETHFGLIVDNINDTQEIVVKPLSKLLKNVTAFAGATIMGDGKISLILDVMGLARKAGLLPNNMQSKKIPHQRQEAAESGQKQTLLLLRSGSQSLMAVPLSKVDRIEEFYESSIETAGKQEVVQYRNSIMPLVRLDQFIDGHSNASEKREKVQVIVYSRSQRNFGLIVDHVYDIVEGTFVLDKQITRKGVSGTAVVENKVTEILDVENIICSVLPTYFDSASA
ncbi:chemotaxis histidine kinase [Legionella moravica]|uniref:Chemotaxis protein CheA n=1 Tax=Legionella moravica TaxID=39962 RepID=A0A378JUR5_9GAMM|nr:MULTISPECIES: chemotaxis protein CheA [Legionella]KTD32380.1 chemotaxis histidine kinase [Legionella moravica]RUR18852.1 histidine kinase [Legionella sp. km535]STX62475.1 chemotaxis histidine kinase [Legionella moravica]